jgi:hypothetical protein
MNGRSISNIASKWGFTWRPDLRLAATARIERAPIHSDLHARLRSIIKEVQMSRAEFEIELRQQGYEPPRVFRRRFGLSHAAMAGRSSIA